MLQLVLVVKVLRNIGTSAESKLSKPTEKRLTAINQGKGYLTPPKSSIQSYERMKKKQSGLLKSQIGREINRDILGEKRFFYEEL